MGTHHCTRKGNIGALFPLFRDYVSKIPQGKHAVNMAIAKLPQSLTAIDQYCSNTKHRATAVVHDYRVERTTFDEEAEY